MPYEPGQIILGKYRIERLVGKGAFAEVYHATHLSLNAPRALKVLRRDAPGLGSTEYSDFRQRFQLEAQLGAQLDHPNVIRVYDFEQDGDTLILVMEYAERGSLAEVLARMKQKNKRVLVQGALRVASGAAEGLAALHTADVVHRDLKPSNILFDTQGHIKVADFGLAQIPHGPSMRSQLSAPQPHPGTPAYMSPEQQSNGKYLTPASDVYALGLVMFEMLTGRAYKNVRPGTCVQELRDDVPTWLDGMIGQMLSDDPAARPWDGAEVLCLLKDKTPSDSVAESEFKVVDTSVKRTSVKRVWQWVIALLLLASIILVIIFTNFETSVLAFIYTPTPTPTATSTPTSTATPTSTNTPTPTPTNTSTPTNTPTPTDTPTPTPTDTPTPTNTPTPTDTPTPTPRPRVITVAPTTPPPTTPPPTTPPPTTPPPTTPPPTTPPPTTPPPTTAPPTTPPPTTQAPTIIRYYVQGQDSQPVWARGSGDRGILELAFLPVSDRTRWWVYVRKYTVEPFIMDGVWYLHVDGNRRFGPFNYYTGNTTLHVEITPYGTDYVGFHNYQVELYPTGEQVPFTSGVIRMEGRWEYP